MKLAISVFVPANLLCQFQTIHRFHQVVRDDQIGAKDMKHFPRILAARAFDYLSPFDSEGVQEFTEDGPHILAVVHDHHFQG